MALRRWSRPRSSNASRCCTHATAAHGRKRKGRGWTVGETVSRGEGAGQEAAGRHTEDLAAVEAEGAGRRRWYGWAAAGLLVVLAAGAVLSAWRDGAFSPVAPSGSSGQGAPATAAVTRQDMAATTPVNATLG